MEDFFRFREYGFRALENIEKIAGLVEFGFLCEKIQGGNYGTSCGSGGTGNTAEYGKHRADLRGYGYGAASGKTAGISD